MWKCVASIVSRVTVSVRIDQSPRRRVMVQRHSLTARAAKQFERSAADDDGKMFVWGLRL